MKDTPKKTKVLFVSDDTVVYMKDLYQALLEDETVEAQFFSNEKLNVMTCINHKYNKAQYRLSFGPDVWALNKRLLNTVKKFRPDIVFLYTGRLISPKSVREMRQMGIYVVLYCNDDPFNHVLPKYFWRNTRNAAPDCSIVYACRHININDYRAIGCKRVELLRFYYSKHRHYYIEDEKINLDIPKVVFIGHFENDQRDKYLKALLDEGIEVGVPHAEWWEQWAKDQPNLKTIPDSHERYNEILNKAEIALVFLSKINNDSYTFRCFEIPATKTMMLAPYTEDLASLFKENEEAVFFRDKCDFVEKVKYYLVHDEERRRIAEGGYARVMADRHEAGDRVHKILDDYHASQKALYEDVR